MMWLLFLACAPDVDVASEMQRSIRGSEHALDATLLATELFWWAEAEPTVTLRHGETCGCPCRERVGAGQTPYSGTGPVTADVLLLDYALDGCVPDSGLVPDELLGHVALYGGRTAYEPLPDDLEWEPAVEARGDGRSPIATDVVGRWEGDELTLEGSLVWNGVWAELAVTAVRGEDGLTLAGKVVGPDAWVTLDAVEVGWGDMRGRCPRATAGAFLVNAPREPVRLDAATDGRITASWRGEISQPTDPCDVL